DRVGGGVPGAGGRNGLVADHELAVENDVVDDVAIERKLEGFTHALVRSERRVVLDGVGDVDGDALVTQARDAGYLEVRIGGHGAKVGGGRALDEVEVAGLQVGEAHARVGDRQEDHAVEG